MNDQHIADLINRIIETDHDKVTLLHTLAVPKEPTSDPRMEHCRKLYAAIAKSRDLPQAASFLPSIVNSLLHQKRSAFVIARQAFRDLIKNDRNLTRRKRKFDNALYAQVMGCIFACGLFEVLREPEREREALCFNVIDPVLLGLIGLSEQEVLEQKKETIAFVTRSNTKQTKERSTFAAPDEQVRPAQTDNASDTTDEDRTTLTRMVVECLVMGKGTPLQATWDRFFDLSPQPKAELERVINEVHARDPEKKRLALLHLDESFGPAIFHWTMNVRCFKEGDIPFQAILDSDEIEGRWTSKLEFRLVPRPMDTLLLRRSTEHHAKRPPGIFTPPQPKEFFFRIAGVFPNGVTFESAEVMQVMEREEKSGGSDELNSPD